MQRKFIAIIILPVLLLGCGLNTQLTGTTPNDVPTVLPLNDTPAISPGAVQTTHPLPSVSSNPIDTTIEATLNDSINALNNQSITDGPLLTPTNGATPGKNDDQYIPESQIQIPENGNTVHNAIESKDSTKSVLVRGMGE